MDHEKEEHQEYPKAYAPIPKGVIKEEETSGENDAEQQMMYPVAYLPLPRGLVKEEPPSGDAQEECNGQVQQLMASSPTSNETINEELERSDVNNHAELNVEEQLLDLESPLAYPPLPRGVIKEESLEEEPADQLIAYLPIPRGRIKEESVENRDDFNLEEHQVNLGHVVAYLPIPRGAIKDEQLEEKENDEQHKQVIAYPPIARGRIKEELESDVNISQDGFNLEEHQLDLEPLVAYPPIPRGAFKEEPLEEQECGKKVKQHESHQSGDKEEDFNLEEHQPIPQDERGNHNLVYESTSDSIITISADVSTADRGNGTNRRLSQRRMKITIDSPAVISPNTGSDDQSAKTMPTISSRTRRSLHQLERSSTSMTRDTDGEKNGNSTLDRGSGTQRPKPKKRKNTSLTADIPSSTGSGDHSAKTMSPISSRTRRISIDQLKRGKIFMTIRDAVGENDDHSTAESDGFGGHKSGKTVSTISTRTRSHYSKPGSASKVREDNGETSEKRKEVNKVKGTKEKKQQGTKDDKRNETSENSSLSIDGDSSSTSDEATERSSDNHNKFACEECGRGFQRKCSLRLHFVKTHTGTRNVTRPLNSFKCDKCMKTYKTKNNLVQHLLKECQLDPAFPCSQCDYKATRKSSLRKHLISIHKVDRSQLDNVSPAAALRVRPILPFKCEKCEGTFKSKDNLNSHKKRVCGVAKSFSCVKCDYRTAQKGNLRKHLMYVHDVEPSRLADFGAGKVVRPQMPFKCDKCERSYNKKHHLKRHMDLECGKIPSFPCNQCGYRATQNASLKKHIDAVHGASASSLQA